MNARVRVSQMRLVEACRISMSLHPAGSDPKSESVENTTRGARA